MTPPSVRTLLAPAAAALAALGAAAAIAVGGSPGAKGHDPAPKLRDPVKPLVLGHRGAAGYRPEHTLASYELAARMGADYIEPDLVLTKDGVLVARHEPEIEDTTDVESHPEFAGRRATKTIDGAPFEGFFVEDFTLAELKTLRATERLPLIRQENTLYDGRYEIPTFQEVLDLRKRLEKELGRTIGVYPETKHPSYHDAIGLSLEEPLVRALNANGLNRAGARVFVQSFEVANLRELNGPLRVPIVQLFGSTGQPADFTAAGDPCTYDDLAKPAALREIATYADGIGPNKERVIPIVGGALGTPTSLVSDAHAAGLQVHPYTFRNENNFLPPALRKPPGTTTALNDYGDAFAEYRAYLGTGIDGLFTDNADTAVTARADFLRKPGA